MKHLLCALALIVASFSPLSAQISASITGKIEDATGGPVSGATVTVKSLETGAVRVVNSGENGRFEAQSLPLGPQEVRVEKQGFKGIVRTGINLAVGQEAVLNMRLEVGEIAQQV